MKNKNKLIQYGYIIYLILLIIITIMSVLFDIRFIPLASHIISYTIYYVIALNGVYSFYKKDYNSGFFESGTMAIILTVISFLILLVGDLLLIPPVLVVLSLIFKRNDHVIVKMSITLLATLGMLMFILIMLSRGADFPDGKILKTINSPDGKHRVVQKYVDGGALGGNIIVKLERDYFNTIIVSKRLMISDKELKIEWLDDQYITINGTTRKGTLFK